MNDLRDGRCKYISLNERKDIIQVSVYYTSKVSMVEVIRWFTQVRSPSNVSQTPCRTSLLVNFVRR